MSATSLLGLPLIDAAQSQKHLTHNSALLELDGIVHLAVASRNATVPPAAPTEGDRYLVGVGATGAFLSQANAVALWQSGAWVFLVPKAGWRAYVAAENLLVVFDGTQWRDPQINIQSLQNLTSLGVGTTADSTNCFAAKSNAMLLTARASAEGGSGDLRVALNKAASANTGSFVLQTNWSGRAELGLSGDDHFRVKVSPDGTAWATAIDIDPATARVSLPGGFGASAIATSGQAGVVKPGPLVAVAADGTLSPQLGAWTSIASAATIDIGAQASLNLVITGTTTISSFGATSTTHGMTYTLRFAAAMTLTNGANLILPGGANIVTAAGDVADVVWEGAGVWRVIAYQRASGASLSASGVAIATSARRPASSSPGRSSRSPPTARSRRSSARGPISRAPRRSISARSRRSISVITGTTTISSFGATATTHGMTYTLRFATALTLTNTASLILPGGANIVTAAGDVADVVWEGASVWRVIAYQRASGMALSAGSTTGLTGFRNRLVNGDMRISQRGAQTIAAGTTAYSACDRFYVTAAGAAATTSQASGLSVSGSANAVSVVGAAGNTQLSVGQRLEAVNVADLAGLQVTVSGWLYSSVAVTPTLAVASANSRDNFSAVTLASGIPALPALAANTWTSFAATFTRPAAATNGAQIEIGFGATIAGVTRQLTSLQLEAGASATSFERRPYGLELALCQRYYSAGPFDFIFPSSAAGWYSRNFVYFPVTMRSASTVVLSVSYLGGATTPTVPANYAGGFLLQSTSSAAGVSNEYQGAWTASAEL